MLQTLLKIGEWQSQGKSEWDRFLEYPKIEKEDKYGNPIINYTLPIIFDLDQKQVIISQDNLREYEESKVKETLPLKIKGGNNKAIYTSTPAVKINQIYKTFFGKEGEDTKNGELIEAIEKLNVNLLTDDFKQILSQIFELKKSFLKLAFDKEKEKIDINVINKNFDFENNEIIRHVNVEIKSKEFGYERPAIFCMVKSYNDFLKQSYFAKNEKKDAKDKNILKLCYVEGQEKREVENLNITTRFGLNKMFVITTQNFATEFNKNNFNKNYQVSLKNQMYLDMASEYLLKNGYVVRIANTEHVIIPEFQFSFKGDLDLALTSIQRKSEILFKASLDKLNLFTENLEDELEHNEIFWINFLAFDTDRKGYFKTTEIIKDISKFHFQKLLDAFFEIDIKFENYEFINWTNIMTDYSFDKKETSRFSLNFNSFYKIIPIKEKSRKSFILKNKALDLFKTILENRKVNKTILFDYFTELLLCHYYGRYKTYTNVKDYSQNGNKTVQDYLKLAIRDSVFKYHAFIQFLKKINLIDMEETKITESQSENKYDQAIQEFFMEMNLNQEQKAMFYLGRMLHAVEKVQLDKKIKKTVIHLVNFNGLDEESIKRLRNDLINKAKQHNQVAKIKFFNGQFGSYFNFNSWEMDSNEALFFVLTGYSFRFTFQESEEQQQVETNE